MKRVVLLLSAMMLVGQAVASRGSQDPWAVHQRYVGHLTILRGTVIYGYPDGLGHYRDPVSREVFAGATSQLLELTGSFLDSDPREFTPEQRTRFDAQLGMYEEGFWRLEFFTREFLKEMVGMGWDHQELQTTVENLKRKFANLGVVLRDPYRERFSVVPEGHWADSAIHNLRRAGVLYGYPDGEFRPG